MEGEKHIESARLRLANAIGNMELAMSMDDKAPKPRLYGFSTLDTAEALLSKDGNTTPLDSIIHRARVAVIIGYLAGLAGLNVTDPNDKTNQI